MADLAASPAGLAMGHRLLRLLGSTLHLGVEGRDGVEALRAQATPIIYTVWHGRLLMLPYCYGRVYGRARRVHVLISRSRDGELLSRLVRGFGLEVVRGSSSRGGAGALRSLARLLTAEAAEVVIVPDGPRGPRYVAQPGPVQLARLTQAPIVPVGFGVSRGTVLRSWDQMVVPHPFARAALVFGEPIRVGPEGGPAWLETARSELEAALRRTTMDADRRAGARRVLAV
jgi:lysophospholipid acyltransferase (LPLAT)-like uncharacterized protein